MKSAVHFNRNEEAFVQRLDTFLSSRSKLIILTDSNVAEHCIPDFIPCHPLLAHAEIIEVEAGENSKSLEVSAQIWETLADLNADRNTLLINLGGGVITDLGGWIASTYKRGIPFINIPTSLLGMVDASVGGKTGIDFISYKNLIGTFAQPVATIIYPQFLESLPQPEWLCGFAEMLKHALIGSEKQWNALKKVKQLELKSIRSLVKPSMEIKNSIVKKDPTENSIRKSLNFGHTIGHAVESYLLQTENPISHGQAVGIGMLVETEIAHARGILSSEHSKEMKSILMNWYNPSTFALPEYKSLVKYIAQDKKNSNDKWLFVLPDRIGSVQIDCEVKPDMVAACYDRIIIA